MSEVAELEIGGYAERVIDNRFGVLLAEKRSKERRRIPLSEVASVTGIAWRTLQAWENNQVTRFDADILDRLCEYFGVQPGALLEYHDPLKGEAAGEDASDIGMPTDDGPPRPSA